MATEVNRQALHRAVDDLPPSELAAALRYLQFLRQESLAEEAIDELTAGELTAARAENGEVISLAEARRRLGL